VRIVVIPAVMNTPLRQRGVELGIALGARHRVLVLTGERQASGLSLFGKARWHLRQALTFSARPLAPGATAVRLPCLPRWPRLSRALQSAVLRVVARAWRCDAVLTENTGEVRAPRGRGRVIVYDVMDDHAAGWEGAGRSDVAEAIRSFQRREISAAAAVVASSRPLRDLALRDFGRTAALVPNGVRVAEYRGVPRSAVEALRVRLGIGTGPVLGFTGGLDEWVDSRLVLEALEIVRRSRPTAALLLVGDGMRAAEFRAGGPGVVVTGFVPPDDVAAHIALFDAGLIPFVRSPLTDAMLPIKLFDYGAARKPAVATPLAAYEDEDLPFLTLAPPQAGPFAEAILGALQRGWDNGWDAAVGRYDWGAIARVAERLLDPSISPDEIAPGRGP